MHDKLQYKTEIIRSCLKGKITNRQSAEKLKYSSRTVRRYKARFLKHGPQGLVDRRSSNYYKLTANQIKAVKRLKKEGVWRSCRFIRDNLRLSVHEHTIWAVLSKAGLMHVNPERLKPLERFVAPHPNDLWQADIMGRIKFTYLGDVYLIACLDDHSRFILSSDWYLRQLKQYVFYVWYAAMRRWGVPNAMLQDRGSQYKATTKIGQADYQYYARLLKIELIWARKARTKGKLERFFRFVQQDFVRENLRVKSLKELNQRWNRWVAWYNFQHKSTARSLNGRTPAEVYQASKRKVTRNEIEHLLLVEERRKVTRENTVSLYGRSYRIPKGYIGCRIWVKIKGKKLYFEANDKVFYKQRLKP